MVHNIKQSVANLFITWLIVVRCHNNNIRKILRAVFVYGGYGCCAPLERSDFDVSDNG